MSAPTVDPKVLAAVRAAKPFNPPFWRPLIKILLFHIYFVPTSFIAIPLILLRCIIPRLRPDPKWDYLTAVSVINVQRAMRNFIRFQFQPLQPRQGGLRDRHGKIAATLNLLNFTGPGGNVTHPKQAIKAAKQELNSSMDKVWFDAPPLELLNDVLSVQTQGPGKGLVTSKYYNGPPLLEPKWAKTPTRAFWFMHDHGVVPPTAQSRREKPQARDRPVVLSFHGGAGVTFSAADMFMGQCLAKNLARTAKVDVFSVDYILAPHGPFPVPLMQALAAYLYLIRQLGYRPDQIFIGGDSFGAWLTLQLERYIRLNASLIFDVEAGQSGIPGLLLLSPWMAADGDNFASRAKNVKTDIIDLSYGEWGMRAQGIHPGDKAINPLPTSDSWYTHTNRTPAELAELPPSFIANGGGEVLLDEGITFAKLARSAKKLPFSSPLEFNTTSGVTAFPKANVVSHITPHMPHDFFTLDSEVSRAKKVYNLMGEWMRKVQSQSAYVV